MNEIREALAYILERHVYQKSMVTRNRYSPEVNSQISIFNKNKRDGISKGHQSRNRDVSKKYLSVTYKQLKEQDTQFNDEIDHENMNLYINPQCEYDRVSSGSFGKYRENRNISLDILLII